MSGFFTLEITNNNCVDTSASYTISNVGIIKNEFSNDPFQKLGLVFAYRLIIKPKTHDKAI